MNPSCTKNMSSRRQQGHTGVTFFILHTQTGQSFPKLTVMDFTVLTVLCDVT